MFFLSLTFLNLCFTSEFLMFMCEFLVIPPILTSASIIAFNSEFHLYLPVQFRPRQDNYLPASSITDSHLTDCLYKLLRSWTVKWESKEQFVMSASENEAKNRNKKKPKKHNHCLICTETLKKKQLYYFSCAHGINDDRNLRGSLCCPLKIP